MGAGVIKSFSGGIPLLIFEICPFLAGHYFTAQRRGGGGVTPPTPTPIHASMLYLASESYRQSQEKLASQSGLKVVVASIAR